MTQEEEIIYLRQQLAEVEQERKLIVRTIKKAMAVLGLFPVPEEGKVKQAAVKAITSLASQMLTNRKAVEEKFAFFQEISPIVDKYKDEPL